MYRPHFYFHNCRCHLSFIWSLLFSNQSMGVETKQVRVYLKLHPCHVYSPCQFPKTSNVLPHFVHAAQSMRCTFHQHGAFIIKRWTMLWHHHHRFITHSVEITPHWPCFIEQSTPVNSSSQEYAVFSYSCCNWPSFGVLKVLLHNTLCINSVRHQYRLV